jgi:hypothetical protein
VLVYSMNNVVKMSMQLLSKYTVLSIIDQHYTLSYITSLFDTQAPTCFGIHVPSSGIFLCPHELLEIGNVYVVCSVL